MMQIQQGYPGNYNPYQQPFLNYMPYMNYYNPAFGMQMDPNQFTTENIPQQQFLQGQVQAQGKPKMEKEKLEREISNCIYPRLQFYFCFLQK